MKRVGARLGKGKQERHVAVDALLLQRLAGADALPGRRYLRNTTTSSEHPLSAKRQMLLTQCVLRMSVNCVSRLFMEEAVLYRAMRHAGRLLQPTRGFVSTGMLESGVAQGEARKLSQPCLDV